MSLTSSAQEICNNSIDDDGDGLIDCFDPDCNGNISCTDSDLDGVSNAIDLDDDNDGILDAEAWTCSAAYLPLSATVSSTSTSGSFSGCWPHNGISCTFYYQLLGSNPGTTPAWNSGVTNQNNGSILPDGDYLSLQPINTDFGIGDIGQYTMHFNEPIQNLEFKIGGLDNDDEVEVLGYVNGTQKTGAISNINLGADFAFATHGGVSVASSANAPSNAIQIQFYAPVDSVQIKSGKTSGSIHVSNNNTIQIYELNYCLISDQDGNGLSDCLLYTSDAADD